MKTLVTYMSMTGNTKRIADRVFETLSGDKELSEVDKVENVSEYELIIIAFPIMNFGIPKNIDKFINNIIPGKKIALCITHAMNENNPILEGLLKTCTDAAKRLDLIDLFNCRGELSLQVASFLKKHEDPKMRSFGDSQPQTVGYPNEADLQNASDFAKKINKELNL